MKKILISLFVIFSICNFAYTYDINDDSYKYYIEWIKYPMTENDTNCHIIFTWVFSNSVNYRMTKTAFIINDGKIVKIKPFVKLSIDRHSYKENFFDEYDGTLVKSRGIFTLKYTIASIRDGLYLFKDSQPFASEYSYPKMPPRVIIPIEQLYYCLPYTNSYYEVIYSNVGAAKNILLDSVKYLKDYQVSKKYEPQLFTDEEKGLYAYKRNRISGAVYFDYLDFEELVYNIKRDNILIIGNSRINKVKFNNREVSGPYDLKTDDYLPIDVLERIEFSNYVKLMNVEDLNKFSYDSVEIKK